MAAHGALWYLSQLVVVVLVGSCQAREVGVGDPGVWTHHASELGDS